jgi:hypothetical protein
VRAVIETIVGIITITALVIGISYLAEAKQARQRAAELARK